MRAQLYACRVLAKEHCQELDHSDNHHFTVLQYTAYSAVLILLQEYAVCALARAGTDKGFHRQPCVIPMNNNAFNTPAQTAENNAFSKARVTNEHDIGRVTGQWKYIDFQKGLTLGLQPLGLYYRVCALMTNALTCLDYNSTSIYFECSPPTLATYFVNPNLNPIV